MKKEDIAKIETRLAAMKGRSWMYNTRIHKLINYKIDTVEFKVQIITDRAWLDIPLPEAAKELKNFLEADDENAETALTIFQGNDKFTELADTLFKQINNVQIDAKHIPQANAVIKGVNALVALGGLQLKAARLQRDYGGEPS